MFIITNQSVAESKRRCTEDVLSCRVNVASVTIAEPARVQLQIELLNVLFSKDAGEELSICDLL